VHNLICRIFDSTVAPYEGADSDKAQQNTAQPGCLLPDVNGEVAGHRA
jgi:hypothetical protein